MSPAHIHCQEVSNFRPIKRMNQRTLSLFKEAGDPLPMSGRADTGKGPRSACICAIEVGPLLLERIDQILLGMLWDKNIIRSGTGLINVTISCYSVQRDGMGTTCPEFIILPQRIRLAVNSKSAFASTITGDFPPSSRVIGVTCLAAAVATIRPTRPLPKRVGVSMALRLHFQVYDCRPV
jgi:hypothetical protein